MLVDRAGALKHITHPGADAVREDEGREMDGIPSSPSSFAWPALLAALLTGSLYALVSDLDLDLRDEGFLWYGVRQTAAGQVPGADFQAYDPGRYYWGAAWSMLFGTGIMGVRLSTAIFQGLGLFLGLLVMRRTVSRAWQLVPVGLVLIVWMFPRHKLFEPSLAMAAVYFAVRLLESPTLRRHFLSGLFVGIAAVFGRNHGVYTACAFIALIAFDHWKRSDGALVRKLGAWAGGVVLGFSPVLLMLVLVPGFTDQLIDSLLVMSERGTNLPRPVPWPWTVDYASQPAARYVPEFVLSAGYLAFACVYPLGLVWAAMTRRESLIQRRVFIVCVLVGIPYVHHALIRASASHLAQSIHPLLLAVFALPWAVAAGRRLPATILTWGPIVIGTAVIGWGVHPQLAIFGRRATEELKEVSVDGDSLRLPSGQARGISNIEAVFADRVPAEDRVFIAPYRAAYYPMLGKVSPVWDIYMLWKATPEYQQGMIDTLEEEGVDWALLVQESMNSAPATTFAETHRKVIRYLAETFEPIQDPRIPQGHFLLHRRSR